jgi:hypothetical protein
MISRAVLLITYLAFLIVRCSEGRGQAVADSVPGSATGAGDQAQAA